MDPSTICQDLSVCGTSPSSDAPPITLADFLLSLKELLNRSLANGSKIRKKLAHPGSADTHVKTPTKKPVHSRSGKISFVQISDIHLDLEYAEVSGDECEYLSHTSCLTLQGSPTHCGLYFCCRSWYNGTVSTVCVLCDCKLQVVCMCVCTSLTVCGCAQD